MKTRIYPFYLLLLLFILSVVHTSCSDKNSQPVSSLTIHPSAGAPGTLFTADASGSTDDETDHSALEVRIDWENDGNYEIDWTTTKNHSYQSIEEGEKSVRLEVKDGDGEIHWMTANLKVTNSDHLIPTSSPFSYSVGINYESWTAGRDNRNIAHDMDTLSKYFRLIKTFHCEAVGTTQVLMDGTQQEIIDYMVAHEDKSMELAMGTSNAVLANGGFGSPWSPGLMTNKSYTDQWVQMIIGAFKSTANVKKHLRIILLGNEIDENGPPSTDSHFADYHNLWIPQAFTNLKASLAAAGLGTIPVSTIIANYPQGTTNSNVVATSSVAYIKSNWSSSWNGGNPLVLFNQYTPNNGQSTDFGSVINYFEAVYTLLSGSPSVYIGETGFSDEFGANNQVSVLSQLFGWLESQHQDKNLTVPLFVFMAFNHPAKPAGQKNMGLFREDGQNKPLGLKSNITVPKWVITPKK